MEGTLALLFTIKSTKSDPSSKTALTFFFFFNPNPKHQHLAEMPPSQILSKEEAVHYSNLTSVLYLAEGRLRVMAGVKGRSSCVASLHS